MNIPDGVERNFDLAPTDDRADRRRRPTYYARPGGNPSRRRASCMGAVQNDHAVGVIGSGSNLLVCGQGIRGLVIKLDGHLTEMHFDGDGVLSGGGARLPRLAAQAAEQGLPALNSA